MERERVTPLHLLHPCIRLHGKGVSSDSDQQVVFIFICLNPV